MNGLSAHRLDAGVTVVRGWRWAMRARVAQHSSYSLIARTRHPLEAGARDVELVIDGFPRSGNTFAVVAFQRAQPFPVRLSHHIHSAAHIAAACSRGTPIIVTVRQPRDAILSCVIREPYVTLKQALRAYTAFYERLQPLRARVAVADFTDITTDMGGVIDRVNERFDTRFTRFIHTPYAVAECFQLIDDRARRPPWDAHIGAFLAGTETIDRLRQAAHRYAAGNADLPPIAEHRVARPSPTRQQYHDHLATTYAMPDLAYLRTRAEDAYTSFTDV